MINPDVVNYMRSFLPPTSYNHISSETFRESPDAQDLDIEFGTGELRGTQGVDDFHVGPLYRQEADFWPHPRRNRGCFSYDSV